MDDVDKNLLKEYSSLISPYYFNETAPFFLQKAKNERKKSVYIATLNCYCLKIQNRKVKSYSWDLLTNVSVFPPSNINITFVKNGKRKQLELQMDSDICLSFFELLAKHTTGFKSNDPTYLLVSKSYNKNFYCSRPIYFLYPKVAYDPTIFQQLINLLVYRPSKLFISQIIPFQKYIAEVFNAIDVTKTVKTLVIDYDIKPIENSFIEYLKYTNTLTTLEYNFSNLSIPVSIDPTSVFQAITQNQNDVTQNLIITSCTLNQRFANSICLLLGNRPFGKIVLHNSLLSTDFNYFISLLQQQPYFASLKALIFSEIIIQNSSFTPIPIFDIGFSPNKDSPSIETIGIVNSYVTFASLIDIFSHCPQNIESTPVSLDFSYIDASFDFYDPFFFTANIKSISFSNGFFSLNNLTIVFAALFAYRSNDIIINLSNITLFNCTWSDVWTNVSKFKKSTPYVVGFIWNGNPMSSDMLDLISMFPNLQKISLSHCSDFTDQLITKFIEILGNLPCITNFNISNINMNYKSSLNMLSFLKTRKDMIEIDISGNATNTNNCISMMSNIVINNQNLEVFKFVGNDWTINAYIDFLKKIIRNSFLELEWPYELIQKNKLTIPYQEIDNQYAMVYRIQNLKKKKHTSTKPTNKYYCLTPQKEDIDAQTCVVPGMEQTPYGIIPARVTIKDLRVMPTPEDIDMMKHSALAVPFKPPVQPEKATPFSNPVPDINVKVVEVPIIPCCPDALSKYTSLKVSHIPIPAEAPPPKTSHNLSHLISTAKDPPPPVSTFELDDEEPNVDLPEIIDIKPPSKPDTSQNLINDANNNCYFVNKYITEYNKWNSITEVTEYSSLEPDIDEKWENCLPFSKIKVVQPVLPLPPIEQGTNFLKEALEERQPFSKLLEGFRTMKQPRK